MPDKTDAEYEFEKLKLLFEYTKFHIGLYTGIATIFTGLIAASNKGEIPFHFNCYLLSAGVFFIAVAGLAGGTLVSSMCHERSLKDFWERKIGPFRWNLMNAEYWTYVEHTSFWLAFICALGSISLCFFTPWCK